jgi:hypothetical protein
MATIAQLQQAAQAQGFKFEIVYPQSFIRTQRTCDDITFRFCTNKGTGRFIWHNFIAFDSEALHEANCFKYERYNQNTGKTISTWNAQFNALNLLNLV